MTMLMCPECHKHVCPSVIISHLHWAHKWTRAKAKKFKWESLCP